MEYATWEAMAKKAFDELKLRTNLKDIKLRVIKGENDERIGFDLKRKCIQLTYFHFVRFKAKCGEHHSIHDVLSSVLSHEFGHAVQAHQNFTDAMEKNHQFWLLNAAITNHYSMSNELRLLIAYKYKDEKWAHENEAWDIGGTYYAGKAEAFRAVRECALSTYKESMNKWISGLKVLI